MFYNYSDTVWIIVFTVSTNVLPKGTGFFSISET